MVSPTKNHEAQLVASFRRDRRLAAAYLNEVLVEGDEGELMLALRRVSGAFGGVTRVAAAASLNPTTLYRTLSRRGNPELRSLTTLLRVMGLRLSVQPLQG